LITSSIGVTAGYERIRYSTTLREIFMDAATPDADQQDDFAAWREILGKAEGLLVGRERRVSVAELMQSLDLGDLTGANRLEAFAQIKQIMTELGWRPRVMRLGGKTVRGYVRLDPQAPPAPAEPEPEVVTRPVLTPSDTGDPGALPRKLERVSGLALEQAEEILSKPIEGADGNLMRAKTSIVGAVLATQSKADENVLRAKRGGSDVLDRLERILRQARRTIPKTAPPRLEVEGG
jgi:hypothetical protein